MQNLGDKQSVSWTTGKMRIIGRPSVSHRDLVLILLITCQMQQESFLTFLCFLPLCNCFISEPPRVRYLNTKAYKINTQQYTTFQQLNVVSVQYGSQLIVMSTFTRRLETARNVLIPLKKVFQ